MTMTDTPSPAGAGEGPPPPETPGATGAGAGGGEPGAAPARELRKSDDRVIAGVCGGLGRYTNIDPVVWRTGFVLTAFAGGAGLLLYVAAWMLMRDSQGGPATIEQMLDRGIPSRAVVKLLAVGLAVMTAFSLLGGFSWGTLLLAVPLVLGVLAARNRGIDLRGSFTGLRDDLRTHAPPPTPPSPEPAAAYYNPAQPWATAPPGPVDLAVVSERTSRPGGAEPNGHEDEGGNGDGNGPDGYGDGHGGTSRSRRQRCGAPLGSLALWTLVAMAVVVPIGVYGWDSSLWSADTARLLLGPESGVYFLAAALAVVGLYALVGTWVGNPSGLMFLGLTVALVLAAASVTDLTRIRVGAATWEPTTVAELEGGDHRLTVGGATLDLTGLTDLERGESADVDVRVGVGVTEIVVPDDVRVELTSRIGFGAVDVDPESQETDVIGPRVDDESVVEPVPNGGESEDGGNSGDGDEAGPPTIRINADTSVGVVEVQHGEA
ncbi:phage shock protein PspC (stress-responsive transcriptional regulator) [Nocardiopsis aegyptia]|uniref:Phage shock protein PspC (Stress-responsive transcriptional regulator) n=1 Tax=Nocardiopsis aegyptia TaxID=220378 RepID=A0A7Z0ELW1_9ACTN|nr:PspC domain-containing protein [Nocardiopsis aegyptia]NYJ34287.1 phage shock protein PspC (stress-responsive transcriptional regulator) [Nocardiopsis aegyptia]